MIKDCFDLPDCCPNFATATPVDTSDSKCCWKISLNQPAGTAQFVTLNVVPVPSSPVTIGGIVFDPNWNFNLAPGLQSATFALTPTAVLPAIVTLPTVCFDVPPGSPVPQLLEVLWSTHQDILCADTLEFSVADSGSGIAPGTRDKIYQPFYTTKEIGKGTGLGLSVSKNIIENHGGKIAIDDDCPNTKFVVTIPLRQQSQMPLKKSA